MADAMSGTSLAPTGVQSTLLDNLTRLTILRQLGIMVGLAASVALGFAVVLWSRETSYQTLVTQPDPQAAAQIGALMEQSHIDYRIDPDTGVIMVDAHRVTDAKLKLASSGLMPNPNPGYELLDNNQFGSSQFMETARYYRSVEGELARTIMSMAGVREARVHLAIPKRSVFVGDTQRPSASVFVALLGTQSLERSQVAAIVHLVASSVPEMEPQDVTLVDQSGHLLSNDLSDPSALLSAHQLDYQKTVESDLKKRVESILTPILGLGGFHVELSANMDFSKVEQTSENFNPDQPALRSEQTVAESQGAGAGVQGVPGALSNQPPPAGQAPATTNAASQPKTGAASGGSGGGTGAASAAAPTASAPTGSSREQATKNFELDRTVSHVQEQVGVLKRLSVAVVVDDVPAMVTGAKSKSAPKRIPLTQQELDKLTLLVKDAVGFDASRGDQVSMVNQPFVDISALANQGVLPAQPFWQQDWFLILTKQVLGAIFVLVLVLAVLRPIMKNLSVRQSAEGDEGGMSGEHNLPELNLHHETNADGSKVTLSGEANDLLLPGPHEGFESQLAAVKAMIAEDPGRVAQVVKGWINTEES